MQLSARQQKTLTHLKNAGISTNEEILYWAFNKLTQPSKRQRIRRHHTSAKTRKHSIKYYQEIIAYVAKKQLEI